MIYSMVIVRIELFLLYFHMVMYRCWLYRSAMSICLIHSPPYTPQENKHLRAVACDLSATAIGLLKTSLKSAPSFETRVRARAWDITQGPPSELLPPSSLCTTTENGSNETAAENSGNSTAAETADLALLVFTLSAVIGPKRKASMICKGRLGRNIYGGNLSH